jgi:hypothetical protein
MKVKVNTQGTSQVVSVGIQGPVGPTGVTTINGAQDVNVTDLKDGSVLVYKTSINKWTATTVLDSQDVTGGQY